MLASILTSKGQTTIPAEVRKILHVKPGDAVAFDIRKGKVSISKVSRLDYDYYKGLEKNLCEWNSPEDEEAFRDL